jgi:hypothetical protein
MERNFIGRVGPSPWPPRSPDLTPCDLYWVFRAQADWTLTHMSHKDTERSTIESSITLDGVTRTDSLPRWSPNEWPSLSREILSADKMLWTSNKLAQWTLYTCGDRTETGHTSLRCHIPAESELHRPLPTPVSHSRGVRGKNSIIFSTFVEQPVKHISNISIYNLWVFDYCS